MELTPYGDKILSVSEVNAIARAVLETRLGAVRIEGEIANLSRPASGHLYFSLKDSKAQVSCAMFRNRSFGMRFKPEVGDQVIASGKISLYEARGNYQLIVDTLQPAGAGALQQAFEALKQKLFAEGLFDDAEKQNIPTMPARIGVITSPSGAAVRDVLQVLRRRNPMASVIIYPCAVQGDEAATQIRKRVSLANQRQECDVLILCRGGGSMEDLWSFNDEALAREIHRCTIPIVSGVGHEIDFTIADFVADQRAPTPSAAAEIVSPDQQQLLLRLQSLQSRLLKLQQQQLLNLTLRLDWSTRQLQAQHPKSRIERLTHHNQHLQLQLQAAVKTRLQRCQQQLHQISQCLSKRHPESALLHQGRQVLNLQFRLKNSMRDSLITASQRINRASDKLSVLGPSSTLARGYTLVFHAESGKLLKTAANTEPGLNIITQFSDGQVISEIQQQNLQKTLDN